MLIIAAYVVLVPVAGFLAMKFMKNTHLTYKAPNDSTVFRAESTAFELFRHQVLHNPLFIYLTADDGASFIQNATVQAELCNLTSALENRMAETPDMILSVNGYCTAPGVPEFQLHTVGGINNSTTLLSVDFKDLTDPSDKLMQQTEAYAKSYIAMNTTLLNAKFTSVPQMAGDLEHGLVGDMMRVDSVCLPLAGLALIVCLRSIRSAVMPLITLPSTILIGFGIVYFISLAVEMSAFAPELAAATMVAISLDYVLFVMSRFKDLCVRYEAKFAADPSLFDSEDDMRYRVVMDTTKLSAHNIVVSGFTIAVSLGSIVFLKGAAFISSIGYAFFVGALVAVLISLTLMPSVILVGYGFFRHERELEILGRLVDRVIAKIRGSSTNADAKTVASPQDKSQPLIQSPTVDDEVESCNVVGEDPRFGAVETLDNQRRERQRKSPWFKVGVLATRFPILLTLVVAAAGVPFIYLSTTLKTDFDMFHQVPRTSPHATTLKEIETNVGTGTSTPFYILADTKKAGGVLNDTVFERLNALQHFIHNVTGQPLQRMTSIAPDTPPEFAFLGPYVTLQIAELLNMTSTVSYNFLWRRTVDPEGRAALIFLFTTFNAFESEAADFLTTLNTCLESFDTQGAFELGFFGASADSWSLMHTVMGVFPVLIGVTFAIIFVFIAIVFRSVMVPFRMLFTVAFTVFVAFGFGVAIFQYPWLQTVWPAIHGVRAYSWTVPIFAFSLLCALALDYDVFLLTRVVEIRAKGFEPNAAIQKSVMKTGRIISFAGIVMALSFGSLAFSDVVMLNQFGAISAFAVCLDCFVVRPFFVPALMSIVPRAAFWPRKFPELNRDVDDMDD